MSGKKIDDYFGSVPSPAAKRQRSPSTPEISPVKSEMAKVGELTQNQLMACLSQLLDEKLSKLATKEDLAVLTKKVDELQQENQTLKEQIAGMKFQENVVMERLLDLESRSRRNNLIFRGLKVPENTTDFCQVVRKFCSDVLDSDDKLYVNRAHPLGKDRSTIIAHLPDDRDIRHIMSRVRVLKNTGYVVHRDLPLEVRRKRAYLVKVRAEVERLTGRKKMPLVHDHLVIERCNFTWDGKLRAGSMDGGERLKEMFGRDFTEFLTELQRGDGGRAAPGGFRTNTIAE